MVIDVFAAESAVGLTPSAFQWAGQPLIAPLGELDPIYNSWFLWTIRAYPPTGILIGSAVVDKLYSPQMVVTIYKYTIENKLTKKREKR